MKAVILAGGLGTRFSEETSTKPKPMIEIGGMPILWHIMKLYSSYGIEDFIICCGYKGYVIKEYFANYSLHLSDVTFNLSNDSILVHNSKAENWRITLVDTGDNSMTGGRLKRVEEYLDNEPFCFTYGDGLGSINIAETISFHRKHGREATMTVVYPPGRFGAVSLIGDEVKEFIEKPKGDGGMINGGFFVLNTSVLKFIKDDFSVWEQEPLQQLATNKQLMAYKHYGFWQPMDTLRDKNKLEELWVSGKAPWRVWE